MPTVRDDENIVALADGKVYAYRIADLLNDVKSIFDNTFSEDVYHHFGMAQKEDDFSKNLLFSERDISRGYNPIRETLAKQGLDELSVKLGSYFPLSASFDATMKAENTPLAMETVKKGSVQQEKKGAFVAGRNAFRSAYGTNTSVHIEQMGIDAVLYQNVAGESISKVIGQEKGNVQTLLDIIPYVKDILSNSVLMSIERIAHTSGKRTALYGYRLYNLYWYQEGNKKTPHCLVCTVVQSTDNAEGYVFRDIENVTIDLGLPSNDAGMSESVNGDTYTVAQLYRFVKGVNREDGGIKYSTKEKAKYGFAYTKRDDGVLYSERDVESSNRSILANALETCWIKSESSILYILKIFI